MRTRFNRRFNRQEFRAGCPVCDWRAPEWVRTAGMAHGQEAEHEEIRQCQASARFRHPSFNPVAEAEHYLRSNS